MEKPHYILKHPIETATLGLNPNGACIVCGKAAKLRMVGARRIPAELRPLTPLIMIIPFVVIFLFKKVNFSTHICGRCRMIHRIKTSLGALLLFLAILTFATICMRLPEYMRLPFIVAAPIAMLFVMSPLDKYILQIKGFDENSVSIAIGDDVYQKLDLPLKKYVAADGVNSN